MDAGGNSGAWHDALRAEARGARAPVVPPFPVIAPEPGRMLVAAPAVAPPNSAPRAPAPRRVRRRLRFAAAAFASLLAHGALAALVWRGSAPVPTPGAAEIVALFAGDVVLASLEPAPSIADAEPHARIEPAGDALAQAPRAQDEPFLARSPLARAPQTFDAHDAAAAANAPAAIAPVRTAARTEPAQSPVQASAQASAPQRRAPPPRAASNGQERAAAAPPHYVTQVMARLQAAQRFPEQARARGEEGRAVVRFSIRRDGALGEARLASSSGSSALDQAALETVRRAAPFPAPPVGAGAALTLTAPMSFRIE
jgi:protein TonB